MDNIINKCFSVDVSHGSESGSGSGESEPPTIACASECRYALQQFAETFDCCIHSSREKIVLIPQLWSICGVQQPQPCEDTPNVVFPDPEDLYTCSLKCAQTQLYALDCRYMASKSAEFYTRCLSIHNAQCEGIHPHRHIDRYNYIDPYNIDIL